MQLFTRETKTYEADELAAHARWSYYVSSFSMLDRTEGVPPERIQFPFLRRNLPAKMETEEEYNEAFSPSFNEDGLVIRISPNSYHILYDPGTADWWIHSIKQQKRGLSGQAALKEKRKKGLDSLINSSERNVWMIGKTEEEVSQQNSDIRTWLVDGPEDVRRERREKAADRVAKKAAEEDSAGTKIQEPGTELAAPSNDADQVMSGT